MTPEMYAFKHRVAKALEKETRLELPAYKLRQEVLMELEARDQMMRARAELELKITEECRKIG